MQDYNQLKNGTIFWRRRSGNQFTVVQGSTFLLGLFDPYLSTSTYGFDRQYMDTFIGRLVEAFGYDRGLLCNPKIKMEHADPDKREVTFLVRSQSSDEYYSGTVTDAEVSKGEIKTKLKSLRNAIFVCECPRAFKTDRICAMPLEAVQEWGITPEEYQEANLEVDKIYGYKMCKHIGRGMSTLGYPLFDKHIFHERVLPFVIRDLSKQEDTWKQEDIDAVVKRYLHKMGSIEVLDYFKKLHMLEESLKRAQRELP